ncbi:MAG: CopG family transcriptional regulator [Candidatus Methanomethylophilaceae archaeon]|jgi:Arc/MetJ-type ribon-helix-helix transcriptional regulator|nr:CopG family transcriptional regulator [Candidatus Methanomethylophilaceae archaeon]NLF33335.1 CopG family transcriptional regulator [Thermoplasmatales archaeon]
MTSVERVTVRLPAETLQVLMSLVDSGQYPNISDVIRTAVDEFIDARFTPENISKITVDLPRSKVVELESLVKNGDSVSLDDAVRNAVREYVRTRMKPEE